MAAKMFSREQKLGETVDSYTTDILNSARLVPVEDEHLIRCAIIKGMRSDIKLHVLQSGAEDLDDVLKAARVAEAAVTACGNTSTEVASLTKQVGELVAQLKTTPAVATLSTPQQSTSQQTTRPQQSSQRQRSPSPRRVQFDDAPQSRRYSSPGRSNDDWSGRQRSSSPFDRPRRGRGSWTPRRQPWRRDEMPPSVYSTPATSTWSSALEQRQHQWTSSSMNANAPAFHPQQQQHQQQQPTAGMELYGNDYRGTCTYYARQPRDLTNVQCYACFGWGHIARYCNARQNRPYQNQYTTSSSNFYKPT